MPNPRKPPHTILKRPKGRPAFYLIIDGPIQRSTKCLEGDVAGAARELEAYIAKTYRPNTAQRDLAQIGCADVMMLYLQDLSANSPSMATIGYHLKALEPFWGDKTLADVKGSTCRSYVKQRNVKESTARQELKTLQAAINYWHKESPLAAVPKVTLPPPAPPRQRFLERDEVARMLWACRKLKLPHVARFIIIGIYTGTRHGAILQLRWSASLAGGHFDLERGIVYRRGSNERETSKRRPPVRIGGKLLSLLERWALHDRNQDQNNRTVIHFNGQPIIKMKRAWRSVCDEAGLGHDVTPHTLRHTFVTWELWKGRTIWEVAGDAGANASTIEKVYGHHRRPDHDRKTA